MTRCISFKFSTCYALGISQADVRHQAFQLSRQRLQWLQLPNLLYTLGRPRGYRQQKKLDLAAIRAIRVDNQVNVS